MSTNDSAELPFGCTGGQSPCRCGASPYNHTQCAVSLACAAMSPAGWWIPQPNPWSPPEDYQKMYLRVVHGVYQPGDKELGITPAQRRAIDALPADGSVAIVGEDEALLLSAIQHLAVVSKSFVERGLMDHSFHPPPAIFRAALTAAGIGARSVSGASS